MGNESSTLVDEKTPPSVLEARNMDAVAKYIQEKHVRRIVVMVRAQPSFLYRKLSLTIWV